MEIYVLNLVIMVLIYLIVAVGYNIAFGYAGLLNLGHIAFFGIGAYASAILSKNLGLAFLPSFILAGGISCAFGYVLIAGIKHLGGDYLALATLGFNFVVFALLLNWIGITGGPFGIVGIPQPVIFGWKVNTSLEYMILTALLAVAIFFLAQLLMQSRYGKLLEALRDDEMALKALGKNTGKLKIQAMMLAALLAGFGGSLFAHYVSFIDPTIVSIHEVVFMLTIVILGGLATLRGTFFATIIVVTLPELLRFMSLPSEVISPMRQIVYAVILIVILLYRPKGLFGNVELK
jgi:branched-chain amino acid transport system permease protein